jgi:hypothetical protein
LHGNLYGPLYLSNVHSSYDGLLLNFPSELHTCLVHDLGGLLLALLATVSTVVDYRFRAVHQGGSIGFTSMLIIVGSIIELRRSFMAYNVMPALSKVLKRYSA